MVPSTSEMWVRWALEAEQRRRIERIRLERELLGRRPRRPRDRAGRRPRVRG